MPKHTARRKRSLGQMRLASIGALVITLSIFASIALIRILASGLEQSVKENLSFDITLPENYSAESYQAIAPKLKEIKGISEMHFISKEEALERIKQELGTDPSLTLGYNPLDAMLRVKLSAEYLSPDSMSKIQRELTDWGFDAEALQTQKSQDIDKLVHNIGIANWILWAVLAVQLIFTCLQINNTTRLAIYAERMKIRTLTLVGASSWFIRRPLVWRSILDAIIASIICCLLLAGCIYGLEYAFAVEIVPLLALEHVVLAAIALHLVAIISSALVSYRATQRYIKMDGSRIHLV